MDKKNDKKPTNKSAKNPSNKKNSNISKKKVQNKNSKTDLKVLKDELNKLKDININLKNTISEKEKIINRQQKEFKENANNFSSKAQNQINNFKENYIKEHENKINELKKYQNSKMLEIVGPNLLNLELAVNTGINNSNNEVQMYVKGFEMIINQIYSDFEHNDISVIKPNVGDTFNPKIHQASKVEKISTNEKKIIKLIKKGFMIHDRVIIPAIVNIKDKEKGE